MKIAHGIVEDDKEPTQEIGVTYSARTCTRFLCACFRHSRNSDVMNDPMSTGMMGA
jgi:hypothetical protein